MSTYPPPGPHGFGRRLEEAMEQIETELRQAVAYMNDAVVPQVRRETISALRSMGDRLLDLANRFEASTPKPASRGAHAPAEPAQPQRDSQI